MAYKLIGKDFTPVDVVAKVTGRAKYAEDFRAERMAFCKTLSSPIPHARIRNIDMSAASKVPGFIGILTADDVPQFPPPQPPILIKDEVLFVGQPILAVAAESEAAAAEAIEAIKIDFQQLPHVTDPLESLFPGGPNARQNGNVAAAQINLQTLKWEASDFAAAGDDKLPAGKPAEEWTYGDVDAGFKSAKLVIDESFVAGGYPHHSMETRTAFAYWEGNKCYLHGSNQSHTSAVPNIARFIGIPPEDLVFIAEFCGGGFGSKIPGYPNMAIAALMSKKIGRPVMHRISRAEEYAIGSARPSFQGRLKLGFAADGKILAADLYIVQETGPHQGAGDFRSAGNCLSMLYQPAAMRYRGVPVLTNTPPTGPQRGPGENQFVPAIEPMMDKAARELKVDRVAIRKINAPDSSSKIGSDRGPLTSAFIKEALDQAATKFNWEQKKARSGQRNGTKVTGIGVGQGNHSAGSNGFDGLLRITPDGKLHVHTGVGNLGTYSHSATARVAAEVLNYSWDNAIIERGDSRRGLPWNSNQAGSLTVTFAEVELDTETGKVEIKEMLCVADCGTVLHPLGLGHQIAGGNVMGIGLAHLERHVYDPKLGIPTTQSIEQSKPPTYLDVPAEIGWGAVDKPDPQNPVGVKGVGEPVQGSGAAAITSAIADALGGYLFNRTPISLDMILNHLNKRPQAHKPLQINTV